MVLTGGKNIDNFKFFISLLGRQINDIKINNLPLEKYLGQQIILYTKSHMDKLKGSNFIIINAQTNMTKEQENAQYYSILRQIAIKAQEPPKMKL